MEKDILVWNTIEFNKVEASCWNRMIVIASKLLFEISILSINIYRLLRQMIIIAYAIKYIVIQNIKLPFLIFAKMI